MSSDAALKKYDEWHTQHEVDAEANSPWHELIRRYLEPERDLRGRRVLEIGCGRGGFSCWLARHSSGLTELVAADFSEVAVEKGRAFGSSLGIDRISWTIADIQQLTEPDAAFDTIFSCETIEHVPDSRKAVCELARVLKPGGRLFLTVPNYLSNMGLYRAYCRVRGKVFDEGGQPICHLTMLPRTLAWVRAAGLKVVRMDSSGYYIPFPGRVPIECPALGWPHFLMRWFGTHSFVLAEKPGGGV